MPRDPNLVSRLLLCENRRVDGSKATFSDSELAMQRARLWPHREHEASSLLGWLFRLGLHRWRRLDLATLIPGKDILHCLWCAKVKVDGVVYDP
jgi:hypothetical protein